MSTNYTIGTLDGAGGGTLTGKDYTSELGRIASALETIASSVSGDSTTLISVLSDFLDLAKTEGIKTQGVYDWVLLSSVYKIQVDDAGGIGLEKLTEYKGKIESLPKSMT
jgi:hypothetical protein